MKANFSTTDLIHYPGDFLPSMNVISAICDTRGADQEVLNVMANRWLNPGLCLSLAVARDRRHL
jgi:hypothetical protein